jgi:hypothetical protein
VSSSQHIDAGDASALASALRALDLVCAVESRARLALIVTDADTARCLAEPTRRREVIALARAHGFTNVAVELTATPVPSGASLLRD